MESTPSIEGCLVLKTLSDGSSVALPVLIEETTTAPGNDAALLSQPLKPSFGSPIVRRSPRSGSIVERIVNFAAGLILLVVSAPILLVLALAIRLTSEGPVFYVQRRLGRHGQPFKLFKFRSMYVDAEDRLQHILDSDPLLRAEYDVFHKLRNDPRVTPIGKILRRTSLDELPQLFNVVLGSINIVGPRAYMTTERHKMTGFDDVILSRKPGITGLWQVSGRNSLPFEKRVRLEAYYVRHQSVKLDCVILLKTVKTVLKGSGAS